MSRQIKIIIGAAAVVFLLSIFPSCSERYPYFIQIPEFVESDPGDDEPGIMLSIVCEDENAEIRYTVDDSTPSEVHGLVYDEPLYLAAQSVNIKAVAVRVGYGAGPIGKYSYEADN